MEEKCAVPLRHDPEHGSRLAYIDNTMVPRQERVWLGCPARFSHVLTSLVYQINHTPNSDC
jgi:hypothetical protein